jgi:hypothetical protein
VITFGQIPLLFLHEGFHILAGQRLGLPSKLRMSTRITYIVLETQMNGVLSVARRRRYLPFLAGMVCDFVVLSTLGILAQLTREADGSLSAAGRVCLALGFTVVVRLAWQFQLYLRTDLYYVFATALNCYDLHEASKALLRNRFWRLLGRHDRLADEQQWTEHDRKVAPWYGPFLVSGILALIVTAVYGSIPVVLQYAGILVKNLGAGTFTAQFWDAVFSLAINAAQVTGLVVLSRRTRRQERTAARRPLLTNGAD